MGYHSKTKHQVIVLVLTAMAVLFLGWVLQFVCRSVYALERVDEFTRRDSHCAVRVEPVQVLLPCVFQRHYNASELTMRITLAAVASFFLYAAFRLAFNSLQLAVCRHCGLLLAAYYTYSFWMDLGYLLMFATHFERLRLTFGDTPMKLPKWAPKVLYALTSLGALLFVVNVVFKFSQPTVAAISVTLLLLLYVFSVGALVRAFFCNTVAMAGNSETGQRMLQTAVRIAVVANVSLLSTAVTLISWIVFTMIWPKWLFWGQLLFFFDTCLNAFCLMCTFSRAKSHYKRVFGRLHLLVFAQVSTASMAQRIIAVDSAATSGRPAATAGSSRSLPQPTPEPPVSV